MNARLVFSIAAVVLLAGCYDDTTRFLFECRSGADCSAGFVCAFDSDGLVSAHYDFMSHTLTYGAPDSTGYCVEPCAAGEFQVWKPDANTLVTYCTTGTALPSSITLHEAKGSSWSCNVEGCDPFGELDDFNCPSTLVSRGLDTFYVDPALCPE